MESTQNTQSVSGFKLDNFEIYFCSRGTFADPKKFAG